MSAVIDHTPAPQGAAPQPTPPAPTAGRLMVPSKRPRRWSAEASTERSWLQEGFAPPQPDLEDYLASLGGVDALIVYNAANTRDPGSVLNLGVPVAMLDGRRATRAVWTALLSARLFGDDE